MATLPKSLIGVAGEYYVAFRLSMLGYAVGLTGRGTPHVDLLVTNPITGKSIAMQVKTMRKARGSNRKGEAWCLWRVGIATGELVGKDFYWALVDLQEDKASSTPEVYFVPALDLRQETNTLYLDWHPKPPSPARDCWLVIEEPDATRYRNNWDIVKIALQ